MPLRKYENYQTCWKKESNDCIFIGGKKMKTQSWELTSSLGSSIIVMGCVHFCELFVTPNLCVVCVLLQLL